MEAEKNVESGVGDSTTAQKKRWFGFVYKREFPVVALAIVVEVLYFSLFKYNEQGFLTFLMVVGALYLMYWFFKDRVTITVEGSNIFMQKKGKGEVLAVLLALASQLAVAQPIPPITPIDLSQLTVTPAGLEMNAVPSGTPVHDPKMFFLETMRNIEEKFYQYNSLVRATETVKFLQAQLENAQKMKEKAQDIYDLQRDIREDLKRVKALKDFGLADFVYLSENILGESLNPADYMIDAEGEDYQNIKRMMDYKAEGKINDDAQYLYSFMTRFRAKDSIDGGTEIKRHDQVAKILGFNESWRRLVGVEDYKLALVQIRIGEMSKEKIHDNYSLILKDTLSMTDGERLDMDRKMLLELAEAENLIADGHRMLLKQSNESVEMIRSTLIKQEKNRKINLAYRVLAGKPYSKNKGFRLADYRTNVGRVSHLNSRYKVAKNKAKVKS